MMEINLEEADENVPKTDFVYDGGVGNCRCSELESRSKKAETRCLELESEVRMRKSDYEVLETRFRSLEAAHLALQDEIKVLRGRNSEVGDRMVGGYGGKGLIEGAVDLTEESDEEDMVSKLMVENRVLECEKSKAQNEAEFWKLKFTELESLMSRLQESSVLKSTERPVDMMNEGVKSKDGITSNDLPAVDKAVSFMDSAPTLVSPGKGIGNLQPAGNDDSFLVTPCNDTPYKLFTFEKGDHGIESSKRVKRLLPFREERSPGKQMAPSTPAGVKPASVIIIDIHGSDDELNLVHDEIPLTSNWEDVDGKHEIEGIVDSEIETRTITDQNQEGKEDTVSFIAVSKRKRASNVFTSDTESDDDNVPIATLRKMHHEEAVPPATTRGSFTPRKRRLVSLRQSEGVKRCSSRKEGECELCKLITPTTEDVEDDGSDKIGSDSESDSDSLNGFIVEDTDTTNCDDSCSDSLQDGSDCNDARSRQEGVSSDSNDEVDFDMIISQLKRKKDHKSDWKFEGEMLAAFGKDPELCMKAVCALYRQQTSGEKLSKAALCQNQRGFNKIDAYRGCTLAEFLTDGDPQGDLMKSVKELEAYDRNAVELCRNLATKYSKQLFEIYKSKEDPYFLPP
ncbi:hypothetical protein Goarm_007610 [Gossypium armourianum]|uniref:Uncharacterized protein n=1 Tax=Gossypium armourianum TaxID=34283 RepID=A0A7J9JME3_9ROSI|nr:hypothetical protein [Gossypium armourianum]